VGPHRDLDAAEAAALLPTFSDFVWRADRDGFLITDMPLWRAVTGQTSEELLGHGWAEAVHPDDRERVMALWSDAVATGGLFDVEYRITGPGGGVRWLHVRAMLVSDGSHWVGTALDVTARHEAERAQAGLERERVLLRAVVEQSPIAMAVVWGPEHRFVLHNEKYLDVVPEGRVAVGRTFAEAFPEAEAFRPVLDRVRETGEPYAFPEMEVALGGEGSFRGSRFYKGQWTAVREEDGRPGGVLSVFDEVTDQVRRREDLAERLQRAMLPELPPDVPGLDTALAYLPAGEDVGVGGDWYDVLHLGDGQAFLVVGDVMGRGLDAATAMSQLRAAVRAYAVQGWAPGEVLRATARYVDLLGLPEMVTVGVGCLDASDGTLTWASAGHPPPLLLEPGGPARYAEHRAGPPLGLAAPATETQHAVAPGGAVVLFTDGAVERRGAVLAGGLDALRRAAPDPRGGAGAVRDALVAHVRAGGDVDDDVALLVVRRV
jgi:PAS domain S-box-containing protein